MSVGRTVVIATRNRGKVKEFADLLGRAGYEVRSLADFSGIPDIVEDGETFMDNAVIKARTAAAILQVPVLADDSGLAVDALGGEPGVRSARYAGEHAADADNNDKLMDDLATMLKEPTVLLGGEHPPVKVWSEAAFVCAIAIVEPNGGVRASAEARCGGYILNEARGQNGFGYDPYFYLPEYGQTMAELPMEEKNRISHRARAMKQLLEKL